MLIRGQRLFAFFSILVKRRHQSSARLMWRQRLIDRFSERGEPFLKNGKLALRPKGLMLSPNFPKA